MNSSKIILSISAGVLLSAFVFTVGCNKSKNNSEDTSYATDYAAAEKITNDVQTVADQAATVSGNMAYRTTATTGSGCATVTHSFNGTDSVLTIDFGSTDCLCHDGSYRRGQIIVTYTLGYRDSGSVHSIAYNNFYHNDNQVTGSKTVTNMGHNSAGQVYFDVVENCTITKTNGEAHTVSWNRVRTWITEGSPNVYSITGSGTLVRPNGRTVEATITVPLIVASDCRWIEAGTIVHTLPNGLSRTVNYGSTAVCDDMAVITLPNGTTKNVTLP
jgi:hypothetical protein